MIGSAPISPSVRLTIITAAVLAVAACSRPATVPSDPVTSVIGNVDQLVGSLRAQGRSVKMGDTTSPQRNGYFSVPSRDVLVGDERLKAFEYETASKADADAALISADGQPNPRAALGWIAAPHFYKEGQLIVLYVGCASDIITTLETMIGPAIATGPGCASSSR